MLLALEACQHRRVEPYAERRGTCMGCYQRLRDVAVNGGKIAWEQDTPVALCNHSLKTPIPDKYPRGAQYRDAMCRRCGCVLRHPDGPGRWEEVIFNGFLIREEEDWSDQCSVSR